MATIKNWIEEQLLLVKQALQQPIVPNTPRDGVLQYCQHCKVGELIAEALLRNILREIALSKITEGQSDIMIRRRFIQYSEPGVINNIQKGYEREVRVLSYDNNYFILAIRIRNIATEQEHRLCNLIILDIDIPYRKDPDNIRRNVAYRWMEYITNKLRVTLPGGHTVVEVKEDRYGAIIRIKTIQGRGLIGIGVSPGYKRIQQIIHHVNIPARPQASINQEVKLQ